MTGSFPVLAFWPPLPCRPSLRTLARFHQRIVYDLLLREAVAALEPLAGDPRWVGGTLGTFTVLHTWARELSYHPRTHLLVIAGGLTPAGEA